MKSEQWPVKTLGELCKIQRGASPRPIKSHLTDDEDGVNWIKISDAGNDGKYIFKAKQKIHRKSAEKLRVVNDGDFILTNSMSFGRPYIVKTTGCVHDGWVIISEYQRDLNPDYLYYALNSPNVSNQFEKMARGSTVRNLNTELVKKTIIPVPSLETQQRIVGVLDDAFQNIENRTSKAEHKLHNGKEMFQSVVTNIFSQKSEGWNEKTLGEVCENLDRKRIPITKNKRVSGEIPYYGASGIVDYVKDYIFDEDLLLVSEDGANLLARTYPIAFSISGKTWVNNHAHVLRFENMATQRFMEYYLNSIRLEPYVSGMAQPKLNQKSLNSIPVPEPPLNQQQAIVNKLDSLSLNVALLVETHLTEIESLVELKQSILQEAFNGNLTEDITA